MKSMRQTIIKCLSILSHLPIGLPAVAFLITIFLPYAVNAQPSVTVYGKASYTDSIVEVSIYADAEGCSLVCFGLSLLYDKGNLTVSDAQISASTWYLGDGLNNMAYRSTDLSTQGRVILIGGRLDINNPMEGVGGNNILVGNVSFSRNSDTVPNFELTYARAGKYKNFVTTEGSVLDDLEGGVVFNQVSLDVIDDVVVDFVGIGLWKYAGGAWSRINKVSPEGMVAVGNDLYADYGGSGTGGYGLYKYDGTWTRIATNDARLMAAVGDVLYVDFVGIGLWKYAGGAWSKINTVSPEGMVSVGNDLYVDYGGSGTGGYGLYKYDGAWTRLTTSDAGLMCAVGSDLYVDFVGIGLWKYASGAWSRINKVSPEGLLTVGNDLYVDYGGSGAGGYGLYKYDGAWTRVATNDASLMVAAGDVLYVDFVGIGLWKYAGGPWSRIHTVSPEGMAAGWKNLYTDYGGAGTGGYGLYKYDGAWIRLTTSDAQQMVAVNLQ